jgi:hypothetical protein
MPRGYSGSTFLILIPFLIVFAVIMFDMGVNRSYLYRPPSEPIYSNLFVFVLLTLISALIQYFLLLRVRSGLKNSKFTRSLTYKMTSVLAISGNSAIAIVLGVVIFQILATSSYNLYSLTVILCSFLFYFHSQALREKFPAASICASNTSTKLFRNDRLPVDDVL